VLFVNFNLKFQLSTGFPYWCPQRCCMCFFVPGNSGGRETKQQPCYHDGWIDTHMYMYTHVRIHPAIDITQSFGVDREIQGGEDSRIPCRSFSIAATMGHYLTLFDKDMEPKPDSFLKNCPATSLHWAPRESVSLRTRDALQNSPIQI